MEQLRVPGREYGENTLNLRDRKSIGRYTKGTYAVLTAVGIAVAAGAAGWNAYAAAFYANPIATTTGTAVVGEIVAGNPGNPGAGMLGIEAATAQKALTVWNLARTARGVAIESQLAKTEYSAWYNVGQEANGMFPLVDFQLGKVLVSLKTIFTGGSTWLARMQSHIRALANNGATVDGALAKMVLVESRTRRGPGSCIANQIRRGPRSNCHYS